MANINVAKVLAQLLEETRCIKVINVEHGNYWRCPHCRDDKGHSPDCVIQRTADAIDALYPAPPSEAEIQGRKGPWNLGHIGDFRDAFADQFGVERFQGAMLVKLAKKRSEGRGGWNREADDDGCSIPFLRQLLSEHVEKGDPVDVANIAMMIWNRENPTAKPSSPALPEDITAKTGGGE